MVDKRSKKDELKRQSARAAQKADEILAGELETLRKATVVDLERLRPKVADTETYSKLIAIVEESTRNNESVVQLKSRIEQLGEKGLSLVKTIAKFLI